MNKIAFVGHLIATAIGLLAIAKSIGNRSLPKWKLIPISFGVFLFEFVIVRTTFPSTPLWDFLECYYPAGHAALLHDTTALTTLYEKVVQGFVNMPIVAYLFAPFGLLGSRAAGIVYTFLGLGFTAAAWVLLARVAQLERRERWLLALLFLANGPLINGLKFGNTSQFILFILVAGLALLRGGRVTAAGALLGASAVLKPALLLFGVFFLARRDLRGTLSFFSTIAIISLASLVLFGWQFNLFWFDTSILQFNHQWFSPFSVQSIPAFILRLRSDLGILTSWHPLTPSPNEKIVAQLSVGLLYLTAAAAWVRGRQFGRPPSEIDTNSRLNRQYLIIICLCVVSSPLSWSHYYCWLLIPTAFFLQATRLHQQSPAYRYLGWTAIALVTPLIVWPVHIANPLVAMLYQSFAVSYLLAGGLLWFGLVVWCLASPSGPESVCRPLRSRAGTPYGCEAVKP